MTLKNEPACLINNDQTPLQHSRTVEHVYTDRYDGSNEITCWFLSGDMLQEAEKHRTVNYIFNALLVGLPPPSALIWGHL